MAGLSLGAGFTSWAGFFSSVCLCGGAGSRNLVIGADGALVGVASRFFVSTCCSLIDAGAVWLSVTGGLGVAGAARVSDLGEAVVVDCSLGFSRATGVWAGGSGFRSLPEVEADSTGCERGRFSGGAVGLSVWFAGDGAETDAFVAGLGGGFCVVAGVCAGVCNGMVSSFLAGRGADADSFCVWRGAGSGVTGGFCSETGAAPGSLVGDCAASGGDFLCSGVEG